MKSYLIVFRWLLVTAAFVPAIISAADGAHGDFGSNSPMLLDDEVPETLSSTRLVSAILDANPQLEMVRAVWRAMASRIEQSSALDDPVLSHGFAPLTIGRQGGGFAQNTAISQKFPWPGKRQLRAEAAAFDAEAAKENVVTLRLLLTATAKALFADWYYIHRALEIYELNRLLLTDFRDTALDHYATGLAGKQDVLRAEVEVALLEHQTIALERERRTLLARINTLLNRSPDTPLPAPVGLSSELTLPEPEALQRIAMRSRPELKELTARIEASKTRRDLAAKAFYPDFKVSAGYNNFWRLEEQRFIVGVEVNLPLDRDKRLAAEEEAQARIRQAEWNHVDRTAHIREEVQIAYELTLESLDVYKLHQEKLLPLANATLNAAMADYRGGTGDFLNLISCEKNLLQTQLQSERSLADMHRRLAELEHAVGSVSPFSTVRAQQDTAL